MFKNKIYYFAIFIAIILTAIAVFNIFYSLPKLINQAPVQAANNAQTVSEPDSIDNFKQIETCFTQTGDVEQKCLDDFISNYANGKTTKELLAEVEKYRGTDASIENNCHPITHSIGRYTFSKYKNVGDAFEACDLTCNNGCYHGVMERLFFDNTSTENNLQHVLPNELAKKIPGICDASKFKNPSSSVIFQCLHGVGHAILYTLNYNLDQAYQMCDLLSSDYEKQSCYGGIAMENITAFDKTKRDIKKGEPLYPCTKLDAKYVPSCYEMQTSIMLEFGMSFDQIAEECKKATPYEPHCFLSLGRDLSNNIIAGNTDYAAGICEQDSGDFTNDCITNATRTSMDREIEFGYKFCNSLKNAANKSYCYSIADSYLDYSFQYSRDQIVDACEKYSDEAEICTKEISK